jgi:(S)-2-hydroxyglutarate dehydrogenase
VTPPAATCPRSSPPTCCRPAAGSGPRRWPRDGSLVDDFRISRKGAVVAVRNAPSPAATSSLAIAEHIVDNLLGRGPEL